MINGISLFANVGIGETYFKEKVHWKSTLMHWQFFDENKVGNTLQLKQDLNDFLAEVESIGK